MEKMGIGLMTFEVFQILARIGECHGSPGSPSGEEFSDISTLNCSVCSDPDHLGSSLVLEAYARLCTSKNRFQDLFDSRIFDFLDWVESDANFARPVPIRLAKQGRL